MAERMISVKLLDDVTECPVCAENFTDPRSLPCVHTFCLECITKWSGSKLPGDSVDCPLCRREFTIPSKGISEMPKNIFVAKLIAMKALPSDTSTNAKLCDPCRLDSAIPLDKKNNAIKFCVECQENLCERCCEAHSRMKLLRGHRTIGLGEDIGGHTANCLSTPCDQHPSDDLRLYCLECEEAVCIVCSVTQHNGHKSAEIVKVASEFRQKISKNISELRDSIQTIEKTLKNFEGRRQKVAKQFREVESEVIARADQLKAKIECHKQQLLAELNVMKAEKFKEIENSISEVTQDKVLVESSLKYSDELFKKGSNSDVARQSRDLERRSTELKQICYKDQAIVFSDVVVTFKPSETMWTSEINVVGSLSIDATVTKAPMKVLSRVDEASEPLPPSASVSNIAEPGAGRKLFPTLTFSLDDSNAGVQAVCSLNGQLYVTRYNIKQIAVYHTSTFKLQRKISLPGDSNSLLGLAACSTNNCLYVSDYNRYKVYRVNLSATDTTSTTNWSVGSCPRGLSVNKSHNLLVAIGVDIGIQEYTSNGSLVREISVDSELWQAIELSSGHIAVSQWGLVHGVSVMAVDGKVLKRYGSSTEGSGLRQMNEPRSLAVDSEGFILVADEDNHRILVLNPALTEARELPLSALDKPLNCPRGLCFDKSLGRLYVGEYDEQGRVLVFDSVNDLSSLFSK